ncbi:DUF4861 family protein [Flavobacterium gawalongense]|uniref:DUF4861 domain-containing protein n=1 Tax=Flavobacterium gawalongense TaxID=2594432 RepID=A0A553BSQ1_9FLAO|nr:DUF4861 family protein [Flavobacterium gawalongense]TRX11274.1 DUF4861 domain-containing protein [Flavobacterium gawalongense]TRX12265.1 DUF4861 domain-containing protein [Flavobacterium gawalongense]TRX30196.1 DUF4861 domain-containing protein [Flavobacterium gawalongense]
MRFSLTKIASFLGILILFSSFDSENKLTKKIVVENKLHFDRNEVVSIQLNTYKCLSKIKDFSAVLVKDATGKLLVTQLIDTNLDGTPDELLFQASVPAMSKVVYTLFTDKESNHKGPVSVTTTYARFVPERIDDFAWENDRVAFRTYGPEAQRLTEAGRTDGTLSSGIDLWLKKVNYSIIDSWYAKNVVAPGYYHIDHGEGYDPYHVGRSRGSGGTGIWEKDSLYISKNYTKYRIIATGPLRTIFELDYAPWSKYGVKETKRISLDLGSNFSKFENKISSTSKIPNYTLGITLHKEKGVVAINAQKGVFRHWEPIDDSFVGEGIVIDPSVVKTAMNHHSKAVDQSQILVVTAPKKNTLTYYVGFAWTGSGQVQSVQDWDAMLEKQSQAIQNPLSVTIK